LQHDITAFAIDASQFLHMLVKEVVAGHFVGHRLGKRGSVQIGALLELRSLAMTSGGATIQPSRKPGASVLEKVLK
jgi:hypothetical protein